MSSKKFSIVREIDISELNKKNYWMYRSIYFYE